MDVLRTVKSQNDVFTAKKILNSAVATGYSVHILLRDATGNTTRSECRVVRVQSLFPFHCALDAQDVETAAGTLIQII